MELNDYEVPPLDFDEIYAPRPKASQRVAAAQRARGDEEDETVAAPTKLPPALIVAAVGIAFGVALVLLLGTPHAATPLVLPTPQAAAFAPPTDAPLPTPTPATFIVSAYAAPDGALLGPVDLDGEAVQAVARAGASWVQLERGDHTRVWFRRGDLPANLSVPDALPDLAVQPPPQTGRGLTVEQVPAEAPVPDAPTPLPAPPTSVPARAADFAAPSQIGTCLLIGCLGAQAVAASHEQACHALAWQYGEGEASAADRAAVAQCKGEGLWR